MWIRVRGEYLIEVEVPPSESATRREVRGTTFQTLVAPNELRGSAYFGDRRCLLPAVFSCILFRARGQVERESTD